MKFSAALLTIATLATSVFSTALSPPDNSSCFSHILPVLRINRDNRRDIQGDLDAHRSIEWNPNRNVRVIIDFSSTTTRNRQLRYQITNRSQLFGAAIIFSNYQDTITGTVRETIRVPIGRATGMSLSPTPTTGAGCIVLDRLDGTWYAQLE
ncbi:EC13 protein [Colletotrichum godetiae]|uniref:EC13 protein n=1 Tax=Colletotrichum godetiae TaxID=1209918 RepID=A0AAJ0A634_9PEZI|nr:EC13 protein [Colletotrichum godetiae]KAK1657163.1 EC13 protein [Colletotrichum godetiae]